MVSVYLDTILRAPHIEEQDVKVEDGVRGDDVTCRGQVSRSVICNLQRDIWIESSFFSHTSVQVSPYLVVGYLVNFLMVIYRKS